MFRRKKTPLLYGLSEAMTHIMVCGRPGSGKTSAVLKRILRELLAAGAVCMGRCVKPDEADRLARLMPDAIRFSPTSGHVFNPLTYTMARKGARHLAAFHDELNEVMTRSTSDQTESFWKSGVTDTLVTAFELAWLVKREAATYQDCYDIILNMPHDGEHAASEAFLSNPCGQFLEAGLSKAPHTAMPLADFILRRIPTVGDKARGAFVTQAMTSIQPFITPPLANCVNGESNFTPERMVNTNTILDFDTLTYGINGLAVQLLFSWFAMEEVLARKSWKKPFILHSDEYHQLAHARRDIQAMSVGRSQGFIGISAFQSIPVLEDALGADLEAQTQAKALIGLHVNKVWCNNNCHISNEFAAMSIGQERRMFFGGSAQPVQQRQSEWYDVLGVGHSPNFSFNQQFHYRVDPLEFTTLRTGGPEHDFLVDAVVTRGTNQFEFVTLTQR